MGAYRCRRCKTVLANARAYCRACGTSGVTTPAVWDTYAGNADDGVVMLGENYVLTVNTGDTDAGNRCDTTDSDSSSGGSDYSGGSDSGSSDCGGYSGD